jgi:hypothetical protein
MGDTGDFSAANVNACEAQGIEPLLSMKRESHQIPVRQRFKPDAPAPATDDPVVRMAHRLGTKTGRVLYGLRKQTVEPAFGIIKRVMGWRQMSMRGLDKARGEWSLMTMAWNIKRLHVLRAALRGRQMPPTTLTTWPCNGSWATRSGLSRVEKADCASRRRERRCALDAIDPRGSSPTDS